MEQKHKVIPFATIIATLQDESQHFPNGYLERFSDISRQDLDALKKVWLEISPDRRATLMKNLEELSEDETLVSFDDLSMYALTDPDARVRASAVRLLWEAQHLKLVPILINLLENDPDAQVRAAAATGLGGFIYLGELEEISPETLHHVEERLLSAATTAEPPIVRQRAVESLGFSSREEVISLIQAAYQDQSDPQWLISSLFAMGRSADPRWEQNVLSKLSHHNPSVQAEAIRAAGNLELSSARQTLIDLIQEYEDLPDDTFDSAVWSLSQIGGEMVRPLLMRLQEEADEDDAIFFENALENLDFTENFELFDMFDFEEGEEEDEDEDNGNLPTHSN